MARKFCCDHQKQLLTNDNIYSCLKIIPRYVVFERDPANDILQKTIEITNTHSRFLIFRLQTDLSHKFEVHVFGNLKIEPQQSVVLKIIFNSKRCTDNRHYRIFFTMEHPNFTVEVPVLVQFKKCILSLPEHIQMPVTSPKITCFYGFVICNPTLTTVKVYTKWDEKMEAITFQPKRFEVPPKSYKEIHFKECRDTLCSVREKISYHRSDTYSNTVIIEGSMVPFILYLSQRLITFKPTQMGDVDEFDIYLCNESEDSVKYKWCRHESKQESSEKDEYKGDEVIKDIYDSFKICPKGDVIHGFSSQKIHVSFTPPDEHECYTEPPYELTEKGYLGCSTDVDQRIDVVMMGSTFGPSVDFQDNELDLGNIYIGEIQFFTARIINKGPCIAKLSLAESDTSFSGLLKFSPKDFAVGPFQTKDILFEYIAQRFGKFIEKLSFDVRYNGRITIYIKGKALRLKLETNPTKLCFGNVPICTLQKKYIDVRNNYKLPIIINASIEDDGNEDPLVLFMNNSQFNCKFNLEHLEEKPQFLSTEEDFCKVKKQVSSITTTLLRTLKNEDVNNLPDPTGKVLEDVITTVYDENHTKCSVEFMKRNWDILPRRPREFSVETESFYLQPDETARFCVNLAPNRTGTYTRYLVIKQAISVEESEVDSGSDDDNPKIEAQYLNTKIQITHTCCIPELEPADVINLETYVDCKESLTFMIGNKSPTAGFFFLVETPKLDDCLFEIGNKKAIIQRYDKTKIIGCLRPLKPGEYLYKLPFQVLGSAKKYFYEIKIIAKQPEVQITPRSMSFTQDVLQETDATVVVKNVCKTLAKINMSMGTAKFVKCTPKQAVICPNKEEVIHIITKYYDPGKYKETLLITLEHTGDLPVSITYTIEKMPIFFEPDLREGLFDVGVLFASDQFYEFDLTLTNKGKRAYKIGINTKNMKKGIQTNDPVPQFRFEPKTLNLYPEKTEKVLVTVRSLKRLSMLDEFSMRIDYPINIKIYEKIGFFCKAEFIIPRIKWSKYTITMDIYDPDSLTKTTFIEEVTITNCVKTDTDIEIETDGPFIILDCAETKSGAQLTYRMRAKEKKKLLVYFDKSQVPKDKLPCSHSGFIRTLTPTTQEKDVRLHVNLIYPTITLCQKELLFVARYVPFNAFFKIHNPGIIKANYKWRLNEEAEYSISEDFKEEATPMPACQCSTTSVTKGNAATEYTEADEYENKLDCIPRESDISEEIKNKRRFGLIRKQIDTEKNYIRFISGYIKFIQESEDEIEKETLEEAEASRKKKKKGSKMSIKDKNKKGGKAEQNTSKKGDTTAKSDKSKKDEPQKKGGQKELVPEIEIPTIKFTYDRLTEEELFERTMFEVNSFLELNEKMVICGESNHSLTTKESLSTFSQESFVMDHYRGCISSEESKLVHIFFSGCKSDSILKASYELEILSGEHSTLEVVVSNEISSVEIYDTKYDFGHQPWYCLQHRNLQLTNKKDIKYLVEILENCYSIPKDKFIKGYITLCASKSGLVDKNEMVTIDFTVYLGLLNYFNESIGIELNKQIPYSIHFEGKGEVPFAFVLDLKRPYLGMFTQDNEYETLRQIYNNEIIDLEIGYELPTMDEIQSLLNYLSKAGTSQGSNEDKNKSDKISNDRLGDMDYFNVSSADSLTEIEKRIQIGELKVCPLTGKIFEKIVDKMYTAETIMTVDKEMRSFHVFDYPRNYPSPLYIEKRTEINKFIKTLDQSKNINRKFHYIINKYVFPNNEVKPNAKKIVEPLPFWANTIFIQFGDILINEVTSYNITFIFDGPGKANFSLRTEAIIPNLEARLVPNDDNRQLSFQTTHHKQTVEDDYKYVNRKRRELIRRITPDYSKCRQCIECTDCDQKICHAHSFDLDSNMWHTREILPDRAKIFEIYSKVNTKNPDKDPLLLSEMIQTGRDYDDCCNEIFNIKLDFMPQDKNYDGETIFDDYLLLNVHLGPTIPILLQGKLVKEPKHEEGEEENQNDDV